MSIDLEQLHQQYKSFLQLQMLQIQINMLTMTAQLTTATNKNFNLVLGLHVQSTSLLMLQACNTVRLACFR